MQCTCEAGALKRKLGRTPGLEVEYNSAPEEMERNGSIEEVSEDDGAKRVFYLPHRPVVQSTSSTTEVRPVFDASAKGPNQVSLNDCLEIGPSQNPDLIAVLLRFRRWQFALTGDISKAFLQILLNPADRDVQHFLWKHHGQVRKMRFCRVTFGVCSSPFLLNAVIRHHLGQYDQGCRVIQELQLNIYVDDWLTGADSEQEVIAMLKEAKKIMSEAGMQLSKWHSNCELIGDRQGFDSHDEHFSIL